MRFALVGLMAVTVAACGSGSGRARGADSLVVAADSFHRVHPCSRGRKVDTACVTVTIHTLRATGGRAGVADSIGAFLRTFALATTGEPGPPRDSAGVIAGTLFTLYDAELQRGGPASPWTLERTVDIACREGGRVGLRTTEFSYLGGAHPMTAVGLVTFDEKTGRRLVLDSLLKPGADTALRALAEKKFRWLREIKGAATLAEAGFTFPGDRFAQIGRGHV